MDRTKRIGVKYCGGCNPRIDRVKLAQDIIQPLPPGFVLTEASFDEPWDIGILICGCPAACAEKPELKSLARNWLIIAGETIDYETCSETEIAQTAAEKLKKPF
ncbi:MAG TPA: hypothetical protein P5040_00355 [Smithella sp.]|nr:hypothetical protein [Smithella sp.]HRS96603.1 hypothetical protein [Smithella sp.]